MILVVGLSSVWQRTLFFDAVVPGEVNRALQQFLAAHAGQ